MEAFLSRYRNLSVLLALIAGQLLLLAYQVRTNQDVRLIRVWSVGAVTPVARLLEGVRSNTTGFFGNWLMLREVRQQNAALTLELGRLKIENNYLKAEVESADRAKALEIFQKNSPSKTVAARIIGTGTGLNSRTVYVDRGTKDSVERGMAVIVPDGIVGKVVAAYPTVSLVMLATEQSFVASVTSQKTHLKGLLKGRGTATMIVDSLFNLQKVEDGEWFYTSGEDRIFPKGLPVGQCRVMYEGNVIREVQLTPAALKSGLEEVLVVTQGVHGLIPPPGTPASAEVSLLPAPPAEGETAAPAGAAAMPGAPVLPRTEADQLRDKYKKLGEQQNFQYGSTPGRAVDYNRPLTPAAPKPEVPKTEPPKAEAPKTEAPKAAPVRTEPAKPAAPPPKP
jgi:rod shape-determining protein MreC